MKKVTTLLAALAFASVALVGPAAAATVAGVELTDYSVGVSKTDGDYSLVVGTTAPIALAGLEVDLKPAVEFGSGDLNFDLGASYDVTEVFGCTVSAIAGVGLNWVDTDDIGFDARAGAGVSYEIGDGKAVFATYTLGYDFDVEDDDTELRFGISFEF
jgi:hypothetical protein|tara:strand:+ start:112 stop:585 length:474 start_codon:yes stop_codon:yes gene_type:complete